jgi:hypothetical protein
MSENYAVINGKRIELTEEQVKALGIERKNPFRRLKNDAEGCYYYINEFGNITFSYESGISGNEKKYNNVNYFTDEQFANQVALHQLLYRKLLKFAYENEREDIEWNREHPHWYIYYDIDRDKFDIAATAMWKQQGVYFSTSRGAECAIEEVVKPFVKEHSEFVW